MRGEMSMAYGYWRGIPNDGYGCFHMEVGRVLTSVPVEDGLHMFIAAGPPEMVHGTQEERRATYLEFVRGFPATVSTEVLDRAELVTEVAIAPEPLMRGFFRRPNGPGWALVGDACHFKHPGHRAGHRRRPGAVGLRRRGALERRRRASTATRPGATPARRSTTSGRSPGAGSRGADQEPIFRGWATDPDAGQDVRDCFSRLVEPSVVMSKERLDPLVRGGRAPSQGSGGRVAAESIREIVGLLMRDSGCAGRLPEQLLETIRNLAASHREHEKFYSQAPLRAAAELQASSRVLKALARQWSEATPREHPAGSPYAGAEDLNAPGLVAESGVLFMEGEGEPAAASPDAARAGDHGGGHGGNKHLAFNGHGAVMAGRRRARRLSRARRSPRRNGTGSSPTIGNPPRCRPSSGGCCGALSICSGESTTHRRRFAPIWRTSAGTPPTSTQPPS